MEKTIKSIDTFYKGDYFRSRLEARWAVFFEACGIKYEYEQTGFTLPSGGGYLPDFYLPQFDCYAEVKPDITGIYTGCSFSEKAIYAHIDFNKWRQFSKEKSIIILFGNPHNYTVPSINHSTYEEYVNPIRKSFWLDEVKADDPCFGKPYIEAVGFYNDNGGWRLWINGSGEEEFECLREAALIANTKRFEHNYVSGLPTNAKIKK